MSFSFNFTKISKGHHFTVNGSKILKLSPDPPFSSSFQKKVLASYRFSVMGGPMDMTFDVLSETYVRLLKSVISQFISKYSKRYNNQKLLKTQRPLTKRQVALGPLNCMYLIELYKSFLEWP